MIGAVFLQVILIFLNAIFASAEIAVISTNSQKLEKLSEDGSKRAKRLLSLTENPSKFLSTIQVAITLAALLGSAYAADTFSDPLVSWLISIGVPVSKSVLNSLSVFLITIILSYFSIVFGELVPKRLAMKNAEKMSLALSGLLKAVSLCFAPFVWILTKSTNAVLRMLRIDPNEQDDQVTEEEILMMLDSGSEQGTIDSLENEMIQNVFEFDDISVSEICTHRLDVVFLFTEDGIDEWKKTIRETNHTYYPICRESSDDVIGVLSTKKFFRSDCDSIEAAIENACDKAYLVPENTKADVLFTNMKAERNYFAVVVDEYGGTSGVITLHDLIELLVGDLFEKEDNAPTEIRKIDDNKWEIVGAAPLVDVAEELNIEFETEECDTFGGYIFGIIGRVPDDGEVLDLETDRLKIKVTSVEERRIDKTTVIKKELSDIEQQND